MSDPKKVNFDSSSYEYDSPRVFSGFQRIQVTQPSKAESKEYQDLPRPHQQELLSRLIDAVREL